MQIRLCVYTRTLVLDAIIHGIIQSVHRTNNVRRCIRAYITPWHTCYRQCDPTSSFCMLICTLRHGIICLRARIPDVAHVAPPNVYRSLSKDGSNFVNIFRPVVLLSSSRERLAADPSACTGAGECSRVVRTTVKTVLSTRSVPVDHVRAKPNKFHGIRIPWNANRDRTDGCRDTSSPQR
jgi:hypothetical protein